MTGSVHDLIDSIRKEKSAIGFCCQRYAYDLLSRKEIPDIAVIPIDCNSNGELEDTESFYEDLDMLQVSGSLIGFKRLLDINAELVLFKPG